MSDVLITNLIAPVSVTIVGAVIGFVRYMVKKIEKKQEQTEERINNLERNIKLLTSLILSCENPNCEVKKKLAETMMS